MHNLLDSAGAGIQEFFSDETVRPIEDFRGLIAAGHYTREMEAEAEEKLPRSKSGRRKMNPNRRSTSNDSSGHPTNASQETGSAATVAEIRLSRLRFASCWLTWVERWV